MNLLLIMLFLGGGVAQAASVTFTPRELFRVPFGKDRETLGARLEGGNFVFPRDFTMDGAGHVYIYDSNNHRIARFSSEGKYEMAFNYPSSARQIFAHADSHQNLWLLISDPAQGIYYGVYDSRGKSLRSAVFSRFNQFRLHLDDDSILHVILSSDKDASLSQIYILNEDSLLMKKEIIPRPPENHHKVQASGHVYFIDQVPDGEAKDSSHVNRVTDASHHGVADIQGTVIYVTGEGDVYTRVGEREIHVYDVNGSLKGKVHLKGLSSACESIRFDSEGNLYELDGIPDGADQYSGAMAGLRFLEWERH